MVPCSGDLGDVGRLAGGSVGISGAREQAHCTDQRRALAPQREGLLSCMASVTLQMALRTSHHGCLSQAHYLICGPLLHHLRPQALEQLSLSLTFKPTHYVSWKVPLLLSGCPPPPGHRQPGFVDKSPVTSRE